MTLAREDRQFVEGKLYKYKIYEQILNEYEAEYNAITEKLPGGIAKMPEGSETSDNTFKNVSYIMLLDNKAKTARFYKRAIDDIYNLLNSEEKQIIRLKYWDRRLTDYGIYRELGMSERNFYYKLENILDKFAERMCIK